MADDEGEVETAGCCESETLDPASVNPQLTLPRNLSFSKLNACAPEFVPMRPHTPPMAVVTPPPPPPPPPPPSPPGIIHVYPHSHFHVPIHMVPVQNHHHRAHPPHQQFMPARNHNHNNHSRVPGHHHHQPFVQIVPPHNQLRKLQSDDDNELIQDKTEHPLSDEAQHKLLNQVEYYFSDLNLATTDHLMRFISKDPEGYVPLSVVASFRKVKAANISNSQLATILRKSSKLMVSEDEERIKRIHPLTEADVEELQCRVIIAENLPEDHCHQNLMKIFSAVGSVNTIRTCPPQACTAASASRSAKADGMHFSNKLHAFVEYESVEMAEKAVVELNEEGNWRSGLRVKLMLKRNAKPNTARVKRGEEDDVSTSDQQVEECPEPAENTASEIPGDDHASEKEGAQKKLRGKGRGKGRGRGQYRGVAVAAAAAAIVSEQGKQQPPGPRMPDGTRGFAAGRGKPVAA